MDISALLGTVLSEDSVSQLSQTTGVDAAKVQNVLSAALPSLLNGAAAQAKDEKTAEGFAGALRQHSASDLSSLSAFLSNVDLADGGKIVNHLLGSGSSQEISDISRKAGASAGDTRNILSAAAPLLMSLLGQEANQQQQSGSTAGIAKLMGSLVGKNDLGGILSGLLGGSASGDAQSGGSSGILGALGNLLK